MFLDVKTFIIYSILLYVFFTYLYYAYGVIRIKDISNPSLITCIVRDCSKTEHIEYNKTQNKKAIWLA